ncbi:unnamed protein product, partial [Rotaria sordida]
PLNPIHKDSIAEDKFNEPNICYRVCFKFVKKSDEEELICVCNRPKNDHRSIDTEPNDTKWDMFRNTIEELNPAHGRLSNGALFAQLALDTSEGKVEQILLK